MRSSSKRVVALSILAVAGAALSLNLLFRSGERPAEPSSPAAEDNVTRPVRRLRDSSPSASPRTDAVRVGTTLRYKLVLKTQATLGSVPLFDLALSANYSWRCIEVAGPDAYVWEAWLNIQTIDSVQASPDAMQVLVRSLGAKHFVRQVRGEVDEIRLPELEPTVARTLSYVAAANQFAHGQGTQWSSTERDTLGRYEAKYERRGAHIVKNRGPYEELFGVQGDVTYEVTHYRQRGALASGWILQSIDFEERLLARAPADALVIDGSTVDSSVSLDLESVTLDLRPARRAMQVFATLPAAQLSTQRVTDPRQAIDEAAVAGRAFSDFLGPLHATSEDDPAGRRARSELFNGLTALLRLHPSEVGRVVGRIEAGDEDAKFLRDALASAGTPEAQRALWRFFDRSREISDKSLLLVQVSIGPNPSEETVARLRELKGDPVFGKQAMYGLGSAAGELASQGEPLGSEVISELVSDLERANSTEARMEVLKALGNSGHPTLVDTVGRILTSSADEAERGIAAHALRLVKEPQVDALLSNALADASGYVRLEATRALSFRPPVSSAIAAVDNALQSEESIEVRIGLAKVAIGWMKQSADARHLVRWIAENEPAEEIRRAAREALAS